MMTFLKTAASLTATAAAIFGLIFVIANLVATQPFVATLIFAPLFIGVVTWIVLDDPDECM